MFTSPRTGYIARAKILFTSSGLIGTPAARFTLWSGDGTLGPVTSLGYIDVANADINFSPEFTEVDFTSLNIPITYGDVIFAGYMIQRSAPGEDICWLSDFEGTGAPPTYSWANYAGTWYNEYDVYSDYSRYFIELEICGEAPCDTETVNLVDYLGPAYIWALPSTSGRNYPNERFTVPFSYGGRLDQIRIGFYNKQGTPSPTVYLWLDDGTPNGLPLDVNPPGNAMASWNILPADVVVYPTMQTINTWQDGLYFTPGEQFHIGYTFPFNPGDTLSLLSDDYTDVNNVSDRASWWWPSATNWQNSVMHYGLYMSWVMEVTLCKTAPPESTFVLTAAPAVGYISPGDANMHLYDVSLISVVGYSLPVTLDIVPTSLPAGVTYSYVPGSVTPPGTAQLFISADGSVPLGDYILKLRGTGTDAQVKTADVKLTVQLPFDEDTVNFYHGFQRTSNFGAIAHSTSSGHWPNFMWNGVDPLYDGSIISVTPTEPLEEHMAMDMYDCVHMGFIPTQHMIKTHSPWCIGGGAYEENYGEVVYSNFYTEEDVISCEWDSLFVVGLSDVVSTDFSIKIKIYYNQSDPPTPIPVLYPAIYEDWDISTNGAADWADLDTLHNLIYQFADADPNIVFGIMRAPIDDQLCNRIVSIYNPEEVYPTGTMSINCGNVPGPSYLAQLVMGTQAQPQPRFRYPGFWGETADDHSVLISSQPFSLNPGEKHIEIWIDFGRDLTDGFTWEQWYHRVLRYAGFYRGDVNASDTLELPSLDVSDLVYLVNWLYKGGPAPLPFIDQGNVDGKGPYGSSIDMVCPKNNVDVQDLVYLLNYVFKGGPAPIDYVRFIPSFWSRPSLFTSPNW
jgi:hypothetical protein